MDRFFAAVFGAFFLVFGMVGTAQAQQQAWVQIEARPNLTLARERAQTYAARLPDVTGYAIRGGWYGVMLGPYPVAEARRLRRELRAAGRIPADSFVTDGQQFRRQYWPDATTAAPDQTQAPSQITAQTTAQNGVDNLVVTRPLPPAPEAEPAPAADATAGATAGAEASGAAPGADRAPLPPRPQTLAEARAAEAQLSEQDRKDLQVALQWEGFYNSAIDGDFGVGTRGAMSAYQSARGYEPTGVLTTAQRLELLDGYTSVFAALGLKLVADEKAGIQLELPTSLVDFARYEPPFAHYEPTTERAVRVLLISQTGDRDTLAGLYNIMQTLKIVPVDGDRTLDNDSFVLTGQNETLHSYTWARLRDGRIKGFTLIYPPAEAKLMTAVAEGMRASFSESSAATLDPASGAGAGSEQKIDLIAGLKIRRPQISASGFYVDAKGTIVTSLSTVKQCSRITIDDSVDADISQSDPDLGLAVLRPRQSLVPASFATFSSVSPALGAEVAVSGFSYNGVLGAPTLTFGSLAELQGLDGQSDRQRLSVPAKSGDAGGPVFDQGGAVIGMLLPGQDDARQLPQDVFFAAKADAIERVIAGGGQTVRKDAQIGIMAPEDLTLLAADMTVLVSCWN
ncbi:serine protease [Brevirhabdus sp.]|uniref:serine protease n=1 Tax=Brevirhabdus sp. TaxID=2004514 RepID=UPI00405857AD